jgi:hypothetical protein
MVLLFYRRWGLRSRFVRKIVLGRPANRRNSLARNEFASLMRRGETIEENLPVPQVPLTAIPSVLKLRYGKSVPYQKVWQAAVDARLPAEQLTNGRWRADPDDAAKLFEIIEAVA